MNKQNYHKIHAIVEDIELTNKLIEDLKAVNKGTLENILGVSSTLRKKRNLTKELLSAMIEADVSFNHFEKFYQKIFSNLKDPEKKDKSSEETERIVKLAEKVLVPTS